MAKKGSGKAARAARDALLWQVYETELGGVEVYRTALKCAVNEELKEEWTEYLEQTERHVEVARELLTALGLDPDEEAAPRMPVRIIGQALVQAMEDALAAGDPVAAQLCAADCVVEAETKDHANWELVGRLAAAATGEERAALREAHDEVETDEDHHLYHSAGWCRELWIEALGLPAALPPPEEVKDVQTAIGAARAKNARQPRRPRAKRA